MSVFRSLRHRNARIFFSGLLVSTIGTWVQMTAMSLLVYDVTGNATDTGINLLCQFLPMLLLGGWAGAVSDRHDRRRMAMVTQFLQAVQAIVLGVVALTGVVGLPMLYLLSLALGVIGAFDNPARRGIVIELVEPHEISNAMSLNTAVMTGSRVVGPAVAALLVGVVDYGWLFVANGISFLAILGSLLLIDVDALHRAPRAARGGRPVREAASFVARDRRLRVVFVVFAVVGAFAFNYSVSLLALADVRFDRREAFGLLLSVTGAGSVAGSLLTARLRLVTPEWFYGMGALLGVSGLGLAWAPTLSLAVVAAVPVGIGGAAFVAAQNALLQQDSPPEMRGRLLAFGAVAFLGSTPIGAPVTGLVADRISAEWSLGYGSLVALVACGLGWWRRPRPAPMPHVGPPSATLRSDGSPDRGDVVPT